MAQETTTTYICDGCGKRSSSRDFNNGSKSGAMDLHYTFQKGAVGHDGAWGGYTQKGELLLCRNCGDKIMQTVVALSQEPQP